MNTAMVAEVTDFDVSEPRYAHVPVVQPQRTTIATTTPGDLLRYALDKGADLAQLEKLMELQQRYEANEARKAFVAAMAAFKTEPVEIFKRKQVGYKTKEGDFVGYKHAELSDVTDAIAPAMARHGLSFDWDIHQGSGTITVDCVVTHVLGHSKKVTMSGAPDSSGKKNQIQQTASTITYLQRYTLLSATGMSTKDEDDDGEGGAEADQKPEGNGQRTAEQRSSPPPAETKYYDQAKFNANKDAWREMVKSGRKTAEGMIQFIESKGARLTESQQRTIDSWAHEQD